MTLKVGYKQEEITMQTLGVPMRARKGIKYWRSGRTVPNHLKRKINL
jgi:hypothetical protein